MTEDEWETNWKVLDSEIENATDAFFYWKSINNYAASNKGALAAMNQQPQFWTSISSALQMTYMIILGRIFDTDVRAHSIYKFLAKTAEHPELFSQEALRRRKIKGCGGIVMGWLPDYLKDAWYPTEIDLQQLRGTLHPHSQKWQNLYDPIRNKMFAHRERDVDTSVLVGSTRIADLEDILHGLKSLSSTIRNLYYDGREPILQANRFEDEERVVVETGAVMARLTRLLDGQSNPGSDWLDDLRSKP